MAITTVPTFPLRSQGLTQAVYSAGVEASLTAIPQFIADLNAVGSAYALSTNGTSTSSVLIGTGAKSFTTQLALGYQVGMTLRIANSSTVYMTGDVTSYNSATGALVMNITAVAGAGTLASWVISMAAVGANSAASVSYTAGGNIVATNVQSAIQELDTEKAKIGANTDITSLAATGGVDILGTNTNDNALTGYVGEYISSQLLQASAAALTTNTALQLTSISLTAGDWDVEGHVAFSSTSGSFVNLAGWIDTSGTYTNDLESATRIVYVPSTVLNTPANGIPKLSINRRRFSLSATTTIYLYSQAAFTVAAAVAFGFISARRVR